MNFLSEKQKEKSSRSGRNKEFQNEKSSLKLTSMQDSGS